MEYSNPSYSMRIGNTTFIVCVKQSETAKKPLDKAIRDLCIHDTLGDWFVTKDLNLENLQKSS